MKKIIHLPRIFQVSWGSADQIHASILRLVLLDSYRIIRGRHIREGQKWTVAQHYLFDDDINGDIGL